MTFHSFSIIKPKFTKRKVNILGLLMALYLFTVNLYICVKISGLLGELLSKDLIAPFLLTYVFISAFFVFYIYKRYVLAYEILGTLTFKEKEVEIAQRDFLKTFRYLDIRKMILRNSLNYSREKENALSYACELDLINKEKLTIEILRNAVVQTEGFWKRKITIFKVLDEKMTRYKVY